MQLLEMILRRADVLVCLTNPYNILFFHMASASPGGCAAAAGERTRLTHARLAR